MPDYVVFREDRQTSAMPVMVVLDVPGPMAYERAIAFCIAERRRAGIHPLPTHWQEVWDAKPRSRASQGDWLRGSQYGGQRRYTPPHGLAACP
jgi:hypothetical protein